ncbi:MAG: glucoamylase family protein [Terracidiphilus sp.]
MIDTPAIPETGQPLSGALLECVAAAASWDVIHRPAAPSAFPARVRAAHRTLKSLEFELASVRSSPKPGPNSNSALLELRANARMLRAAVRAVSDRPRVVAQLPRVVLPAQKDEPRAAAIATAYLRAVDGNFSAPSFRDLISALQFHDPLTLDELWNAAAFLKFTLLELLLDDARILLRSPASAPGPLVPVHLKSLRTVTHTDWAYLMEPLILFDAALRQDPAQAYAAMDFDSREFYRKRVAFIARHSDCTESQVAQTALVLAREGLANPTADPRIQQRHIHVGYYLFDKGFPQLATRTGFHPPLIDRMRTYIRAEADNFYITGIELITIVLIAALILVPLPRFSLFDWLLAALVLFMPVMQCAVDLVNNTITSLFDPDPLPKLDFRKGIPGEFTTMIVVPTLLVNEKQVRALVKDLEVRFIANRDAHLHFALLTDLADSVSKPHTNDTHPLVELTVHLIDQLNAKYENSGSGGFILLHRHRIFNVRQGVWMGWERKRGKLLDLNKLLAGEFDAFPIKAGRLDALGQIRYVLTLDSDTQLPRGAATRLIGAIAHPLHQAVVDSRLRIVTDGYGILQPRIGVSVRSASRSRLAAIYSGQSGFDIYTRAISDVYQDLYREGSFTGKGIYEVATLHAVLNQRFPRNSLLSHDLIEGAYARAGLASDVELIDDYPSHLNAYSRRKHRWVRGDWQIAQWMFSRVPEESGRWTANPISEISRWKIFDNLRRSLVEPFTFILFAAGWLGLPGGPLYWTILPLVLLFFPTVVQCAFGLGRAFFSGRKGSAGEVLAGFSKAAFVALMNLIFLPYQALVCLDAIIRALVRGFITGERLLEWETAAQAEVHSNGHTLIDRYFALTPLVSFTVAAVVYLFNPRHHHALVVASPILLLWAFAPIVAGWLNAPLSEQHKRLDSGDEAFLLAQALRIWHYFHQFGAERHNFLIPDNVEEDGQFEAARVSPTNLGLLLNARQAACEFGFLTLPEFVTLTNGSFATIARLEKYRGHLFNWYDTQTLKPLSNAPFVSSVDSGNFVASLLTLRSGALASLRRPLAARQLFSGLRAYWQMLRLQKGLPSSLTHTSPPSADASISAWQEWLRAAQTSFAAAAGSQDAQHKDTWWFAETGSRINAILDLLQGYMPWLLSEYAPLRDVPELAIYRNADALTIDEAIDFAEHLEERLVDTSPALADNGSLHACAEKLRACLPFAKQNLRSIAAALRAIAQQAETLVQATEFAFLVDPGRQILSIGYEVRAQKLHEACYDMIASEARIATFIAIARGEIHQESWFKLGREHVRVFGRFLLLSWTGTMFEYLMPALWMRSYPETLIARTLAACVYVQREFARSLRIPWGISESGASKKDDAGHYHYQAFGVPQTALWIEATAGPVVSPYSSFLALAVDSVAALRNLRHMASAGWVGAFGFYEAADFSTGSGHVVLVREWMAHHQGMSLLAILNLLHNNAVQRWFHENPEVQAAELLLHELPVGKSVLKARLKE